MDSTQNLFDQGSNVAELTANNELRQGVTIERDALTLDLADDEFILRAKDYLKSFEDHKKEHYIDERRAENEKYLFGRQLRDLKLKSYHARYMDNIIWESESYIKPMALSKMPDISILSGSQDPQAKATAKDLTSIIQTELQSRDRKRVLGLAFKHLPVGFLGCIKAFWNPEKGKNGDYDYRVIHYNEIYFDTTAQSNDARDMSWIAENVEYTVKEWVMRFPKKEQEFYAELRKTGAFNDLKNESTDAGMNSKVKGWEMWFTWYNKAENNSYERIEAVAWFYNNLLLDKMPHPYWDWTGETQTFKYDLPIQEEDLRESISSNNTDGMSQIQVFHNHLDYPEKPYIFLGYDQWGQSPIDVTSRIEQALFLQQNADKRGKQITEMFDRARGKHVFSSDAGLEAKDIEELDLNDPDADLLIKGKVSEAHSFIPGEQPSPQMIENNQMLQERIFDKMGAHGPTRGQVDTDTAATNNQLAREGDFTRNDDLVDDTINYAVEKMGNWALQFIKLFYTEDHLRRALGQDGSYVYKKINRDVVDDSMELTIAASGTDKLKAEQQAMDLAKLDRVDPLSFYEMLDIPDPKGKTERLLLFTLQPDLYLQKFVYGNGDPSSLASALGQQTPGQLTPPQAGADQSGAPAQTPGQTSPMATPQGPATNGASPQAIQAIMQITQGSVPPPPTQIDVAFAQTFLSFLHSPQLEQALAKYPGMKPQLLAYAQAIQKLAQGLQQTTPPPPPPANIEGQASLSPQPPAMSNAKVGPMAKKPNPKNTRRVATGVAVA